MDTELAEGSVEGHISVLLVHVVVGGSGLISQHDSICLHTLSGPLIQLPNIVMSSTSFTARI